MKPIRNLYDLLKGLQSKQIDERPSIHKNFLLVETKNNNTYDIIAESDNSSSLYEIMNFEKDQKVISLEKYLDSQI